jgi:hypothetical protein
LDLAIAAAQAEQIAARKSLEDAQRASDREKAEREAAAAALSEKIVSFCAQSMGKQVGPGECASLAEEAIVRAGGQGRAQDSPNAGDYVWGKAVCIIESNGKADAGVSDILPGDIIQLRDVVFDDGRLAPHHTAIVKEFRKRTGDLIVFEQNCNNQRFVIEGRYHLLGLKSGWMRVYRAQAQEGSRQKDPKSGT